MKVSTILDQVDLGAIALPEFQRPYVWNRDQVRGLMHSMYRRHPVGSLLVWVTKTESAEVRGDGTLQPGSVQLLLDGQQRITSLYGIVRGAAPKFFEGNAQAFIGIHFNLQDEVFEFFAPLKMRGNPLWVDVTQLLRGDLGRFIQDIIQTPELQPNLPEYIARLNRVAGIKDVDLHVEQVTGEDKTVDVVVDIFNRVNSGGTKLKKGDLALAKICAQWPDARPEMNKLLAKWRSHGFDFRMEWLLRVVNSLLTGEAMFSALKDVTTAEFQGGLTKAEKAVDKLLNLIASRLGLDHNRVLGSPASFPLLARYLMQRGGQIPNQTERDRLLYWYMHTILWGRYAGSTETILNQDLALIERPDGALDRLIGQLRQHRGDLKLTPDDFAGWSQAARFYPLLYLLTRVFHAKDWGTGVELTNHLLGYFSNLHLHHIFPKAQVYQHGYTRPEVNALANFTFLTAETNLQVSDRLPTEYLPRFADSNPGVLESHWIPMDRELWKLDNYLDFLAKRRELLAEAANSFLDSLTTGQLPETQTGIDVLDRAVVSIPETRLDTSGEPDEESVLLDTNVWVVDQGLPEGEFMFELAAPDTGQPLAVFDLAWPNGLQVGLSQPVALLLNEDTSVEEAANQAGYRYFTSTESFRAYVEREIIALVPA